MKKNVDHTKFGVTRNLKSKEKSNSSMSKIQIHIKYSQRDGVYFAGEKMAGVLSIIFGNKLSDIKNVILIVDGRAQTYWINKNSDKIYESDELYMRKIFEISADEPHSTNPDNGAHNYSFEFDMPDTLPSSYDGLYGQIWYSTTAELFNVDGNLETTYEKVFTVISNVDLSKIPPSKQPVEAEDITDYSCCTCFPFGTVRSAVTIPKSGFVPSEPIHVNVLVYNGSRKKLKNTTLILMQRSAFYAKSRYENAEDQKETYQKVGQLNKGSINPHTFLKITDESMIVPAVVPTFETGIINISYILRLSAYPEIEVDIPITIGSDKMIGKQNNSLKIYQLV